VRRTGGAKGPADLRRHLVYTRITLSLLPRDADHACFNKSTSRICDLEIAAGRLQKKLDGTEDASVASLQNTSSRKTIAKSCDTMKLIFSLTMLLAAVCVYAEINDQVSQRPLPFSSRFFFTDLTAPRKQSSNNVTPRIRKRQAGNIASANSRRLCGTPEQRYTCPPGYECSRQAGAMNASGKCLQVNYRRRL
jgi:hypothetical protein